VSLPHERKPEIAEESNEQALSQGESNWWFILFLSLDLFKALVFGSFEDLLRNIRLTKAGLAVRSFPQEQRSRPRRRS